MRSRTRKEHEREHDPGELWGQLLAGTNSILPFADVFIHPGKVGCPGVFPVSTYGPDLRL